MTESLNKSLPDYVVYDPKRDVSIPPMLGTPCEPLSIPLSDEDIRDIQLVEAKYDNEENCAGLAGPQIGIHKPVIVFAVNDIELRKWRPDLTQTMPKTIWVNPNYEGIEEEGMNIDFEGCFSVEDVAGPVNRFKKIRYSAYDFKKGDYVSGIAEGFLARAIQHEIDHTRGILFITKVPKDKQFSKAEYREMRQRAMEQETNL
jgi:peptide deformylase